MQPLDRRRKSRKRGSRPLEGGGWEVEAPIVRFIEPAALLALRQGPRHGYDLANQINELIGATVDFGNLYRMLRRLEEEGAVISEWSDEGTDVRSKRVYQITRSGEELLEAWSSALQSTQERIRSFLDVYHGGNN